MGQLNRSCVVCGVRYEYCSNCNKKEPLWRNCFDTEKCLNVFNAVSNFNAGVIDKTEFNKIISECELTGEETFKQNIADVINQNKVTRKRRTKKTETETETEIVENNEEEKQD